MKKEVARIILSHLTNASTDLLEVANILYDSEFKDKASKIVNIIEELNKESLVFLAEFHKGE